MRWVIIWATLFFVLWYYLLAHATPVPTPVIRPNEWVGVTDNQGHSLDITASGQIQIKATPTATATP